MESGKLRLRCTDDPPPSHWLKGKTVSSAGIHNEWKVVKEQLFKIRLVHIDYIYVCMTARSHFLVGLILNTALYGLILNTAL